jgi:hypothetical protein
MGIPWMCTSISACLSERHVELLEFSRVTLRWHLATMMRAWCPGRLRRFGLAVGVALDSTLFLSCLDDISLRNGVLSDKLDDTDLWFLLAHTCQSMSCAVIVESYPH